ncbi:MAG: hypothetical protein SPE82_01560 [Succinivibrio sp.]|nr:hypothetical protein [Succinivibrio sp.]
MDKKLLLIAPLFFDYYKEIIKEAELLDFQVDYICDAPSNSNISKAIGRINKNLLHISTKKYFNKVVLPKIDGKQYDYVLLVAGMTFAFNVDMVGIIKKLNPEARFVMYQWDSEENLPYSTEIQQYFDELYSFDLNDCQHSTKYEFLPLFYTRAYEKIGKTQVASFTYDCSYVGTAHPQKYKDINEMANQLKIVMPNQFIYHYMPSILKFAYHKMRATEFRYAKLNEFKTEKLNINQLMQIIKKSKCILDAPQSGQTGLTIRSIECLGAKRKLITSNPDIKKYDFYDPANILVFDGTIDTESEFFKCKYKEIDEKIYIKYSLREWLKTLLH